MIFIFLFHLVITPSVATAAESSETTSLIFLHTNDLHGAFRGTDVRGGLNLAPQQGLLRIGTIVKQIRTENRPVVLLDAGDLIHGTPMMDIFRGRPMFNVLNHLKYDAVTLGNHEFDMGQSVLTDNLREAKMPILAANAVFTRKELAKRTMPYVIVKRGNIRIGIVGLLTPETLELQWYTTAEGLEILSPAETLQKITTEIRGKVDILVVLSHLGISKDKEIAQAVKDIDFIFGGHTHTVTQQPIKVNDTLICSTGSHGKYLGRLNVNLTFAENKWKIDRTEYSLIEITPEIPENKELLKIYTPFAHEVEKKLAEKVGESWVDLNFEGMRTKETRLGDQIADLIRGAAGTDIAVIDTTTVNGGVASGTVTVGHLYSVLGSYTRQEIVKGKFTGRTIREMLEYAVSGTRHPLLLQVSGIEFWYDPQLPAGSRISEISISDKPLDNTKEYTLATTAHLFMGGSGFKMMKNHLSIESTGKQLRNIIAAGIRQERFLWPDFPHRILAVIGNK
ncbi:MAG: bifunctional UDP-sugar hydrolase/5'-nucleotidase [bacterium]